MRWEQFTLTKRDISRFWLRRLFESALFVSCLVIVLYTWARFIPTGYRLPIGEAVTDLAAAVSASVNIIAAAMCLFLPRRHTYTLAILAYGLIVTVVASLIVTSGYLSSPFITAWLPMAVFAGLFGIGMVAGVGALMVGGVLAAAAWHQADMISVLSSLFFGTAALCLSVIIWHRQPANSSTKAVSELQNKLSTAEDKSEVVINTIDDGVLAIAADGNIELINPAAQRIIGWQQGDALGLKWQSVIHLVSPDGREVELADNPVQQALTGNRPTHSDKLSLRTSSDRTVLVSIVSSPVGNEKEGIIVVFRDITKEKAEEREQAEFISTASHEMRTPVASIEGYLGLALNPATANIDDKARDFITKAHESAQHLGRLFQDLLDISKAEDGRLKSDPRVIDVGQFVGTIFDNMRAKAAEKQLTYTYAPQSAPDTDKKINPIFYVRVDADHLREIITNLIENAIKYTPAGEVVVDVTGDDTLVTISVKDSGIGIPAEDIPHLFQKFYRVDNSDTREVGGTGLGLYLCRRLAEHMNGRLDVASEFKKGSTFSLHLPRIDASEALQTPVVTAQPTDQPAAEAPTQVPLAEQPAPAAPIMSTAEPASSFAPDLTASATPTASMPAEQPTQPTATPAAAPTEAPAPAPTPLAPLPTTPPSADRGSVTIPPRT